MHSSRIQWFPQKSHRDYEKLQLFYGTKINSLLFSVVCEADRCFYLETGSFGPPGVEEHTFAAHRQAEKKLTLTECFGYVTILFK